RISQWCAQAGIDLAGITVSTAVLYQALRCAPKSGAPRRCVVLDRSEGDVEILGMGEQGSFYSKQIALGEHATAEENSANLEREEAFCLAELRLNPEEKPAVVWIGAGDPVELRSGTTARLEEGDWAVVPDAPVAAFRLRQQFGAYAAALAALEKRLPGTTPR